MYSIAPFSNLCSNNNNTRTLKSIYIFFFFRNMTEVRKQCEWDPPNQTVPAPRFPCRPDQQFLFYLYLLVITHCTVKVWSPSLLYSTLSPHLQLTYLVCLVLFVCLSHAPGTLHFLWLSHPPEFFYLQTLLTLVSDLLNTYPTLPTSKHFSPTCISSLTHPVLLPQVYNPA